MDDFFNFGVQSLYVGSKAPYSPSFESLAAISVEGVQSANLSLTWPRQDAFDWNGGGDPVSVIRPQARLDFSYVFSSEFNDERLGLVYNLAGHISPALSNLNAERNYYIVANMQGLDMVGYEGDSTRVMAFGNGLMSQYSFSAAVGQPSTVSVTVDGLNLIVQTGMSGQPLPSMNKQSGTQSTGLYSLVPAGQTITDYYVATPSAIILAFDTGSALGLNMSGGNQCPLDSFGFTIDIPRSNSQDLGWAYPQYRPVQWPVTINIQAQGTVNQLQADSLNRLVCNDSGVNFSVGFKTGCGAIDNFIFEFLGAKLESQNFSASIGPLNRVSMNWSLKIADIRKISPNFYINSTGVPYSSVIFPQADYTSGNSPLVFELGAMCFLSVLSGPGIISGNSVLVADTPDITVVECTAVDGSDTEQISITVT